MIVKSFRWTGRVFRTLLMCPQFTYPIALALAVYILITGLSLSPAIQMAGTIGHAQE